MNRVFAKLQPNHSLLATWLNYVSDRKVVCSLSTTLSFLFSVVYKWMQPPAPILELFFGDVIACHKLANQEAGDVCHSSVWWRSPVDTKLQNWIIQLSTSIETHLRHTIESLCKLTLPDTIFNLIWSPFPRTLCGVASVVAHAATSGCHPFKAILLW